MQKKYMAYMLFMVLSINGFSQISKKSKGFTVSGIIANKDTGRVAL
jgi:hypothetical protein